MTMAGPQWQVYIMIGVSGAGKTTIGRALAANLDLQFIEGDSFHSDANTAKMSAGIPLDDEDRKPWLDALSKQVAKVLSGPRGAVMSCSALKRAYRDILRQPGVCFIYLSVSIEVVRDRLARRAGHFFDPTLLDSQFAALEPPKRALIVDASQSPDQIVSDIIQRLTADHAGDYCGGSRG